MFIKKFLLYVVCALSLTALYLSNACAVEYRIHDLGAYGTSCDVVGITNTGEVAGWYRDGSNDYMVRWKLDGTTTKVAVPSGFPRGASDSGLVVTDHGYYDTADNYTDMRSAQGYIGAACVINDHGDIAGVYDAGNYVRVAFRWTQSNGFKSLGVLPDKKESVVNAMNNLGQVVGESTITIAQRFTSQGFKWTPGIGMEALPSLPSNEEAKSTSHAINDLGQIAGWSTDMDNWGAAVYWDSDGSVHNLGEGFAYDINNLGYVVGTSEIPVVWMPDGTRIDLPQLYNTNYCTPQYINDAGVIAGMENDGTNWHVVVWEPVPEPSCLAVLLSGVGFTAALRRRSR